MSIEELAVDIDNFGSVVDQTFELKDLTFTLKERVNKGHAKGLLNVGFGFDEIRCSLWRLSAKWHDYKLIQSYYRKEHKCRLKIYYLSVLNEQDMFLVISEEVIKTLDEEIKTMKKLGSGETKLDDKDGFLYPLRSLFDSLTAVREICHDFTVTSSDLFFVKSEKITQSEKMFTKSEILIIKVGFVQPYELKKNEKLKCTKNVSRMVFNKWIGITNAELPKDLLLLRKVLDSFEPNNINQFKMLRMHPRFYMDASKEWLLDFAVKFQRIMSSKNLKSKDWITVTNSLGLAFKKMQYSDIVGENAKWYSEDISNSIIRDCFNFVPSKPTPPSQEKADPPSQEKADPPSQLIANNQLKFMIRTMRNLATHAIEHSDNLEFSQVCDAIEEFRPNCWAVLHYAAMVSIPERFVED
ncbi:uncharacterized protein LOC115997429 [Ipomoea triloba]|uniref:uncharacterized protein LOC115997429 n=1 Tax=Ipomoea triloba TaxID=35885 RepID=UPI00125D5283|nr:uncharacterized protein LOC115997429 [Ipomoea triloba]